MKDHAIPSCLFIISLSILPRGYQLLPYIFLHIDLAIRRPEDIPRKDTEISGKPSGESPIAFSTVFEELRIDFLDQICQLLLI